MPGVVRFTVGGSCSQNGNNCVFLRLTTGEDVVKVFVDGWNLYTKQVGYLLLCQPDRSPWMITPTLMVLSLLV
jgi:hypothetical protein